MMAIVPSKSPKLKPFMFATVGRPATRFKLIVFAKSLQAARKFIRQEAISVRAYHELQYLGQGQPPYKQQKDWLGATVR